MKFWTGYSYGHRLVLYADGAALDSMVRNGYQEEVDGDRRKVIVFIAHDHGPFGHRILLYKKAPKDVQYATRRFMTGGKEKNRAMINMENPDISIGYSPEYFWRRAEVECKIYADFIALSEPKQIMEPVALPRRHKDLPKQPDMLDTPTPVNKPQKVSPGGQIYIVGPDGSEAVYDNVSWATTVRIATLLEKEKDQ